jgi:ligand-binding SRPBCC domain-containing protein
MDSPSTANAKARPRPARLTGVIERSLKTPRSRDEVFPFFADASNLARLTPGWLKFQIITPTPIDMREGAVIDYRISMFGIPMYWRTLITVWEPPFRFVDEQLRGPYHYWRHEHTFEETEGGTILGDLVEYSAPFGALSDKLFVAGNLRRIFNYRATVMKELFQTTPCAS